MFKKFVTIIIFVCFSIGNSFAFDEIEVSIKNLNGWEPANVRDDALVEISSNIPLFGDGSLMFATDPCEPGTDSCSPGLDKADFELSWDDVFYGIKFLGDVSRVGYSFYVDSESSTNPWLIPAFRLEFADDNGTPLVFSDDIKGFLIWEGVYNGIGDVAQDTWESVKIEDDNFWVFVEENPTGRTGVIQNFSSTLFDWINNSPRGVTGDPEINLSASTYITGINVGVGSGWGASFIGYVDAIRISFGPESDYLYNFEVCQTYESPPAGGDLIFSYDFDTCFKLIP